MPSNRPERPTLTWQVRTGPARQDVGGLFDALSIDERRAWRFFARGHCRVTIYEYAHLYFDCAYSQPMPQWLLVDRWENEVLGL